jgi:hypothetical protein
MLGCTQADWEGSWLYFWILNHDIRAEHIGNEDVHDGEYRKELHRQEHLYSDSQAVIKALDSFQISVFGGTGMT